MPATCVIGLQWGDEAKGKLVNLLTEQHDLVVRYQGGANAGHTVVAGDQTYKLSLIPSGILAPRVLCVVTGGVVVHPQSILSEIDGLASRGIEVSSKNLVVSDRAHVIFPWHVAEDQATEASSPAGGEAIGTTQRGIGPCYRDKVGRTYAIRLGDLYRPGFAAKVEQVAAAKSALLAAAAAHYSAAKPAPLDAAKILAEYGAFAERLKPFVADTTALLLDAVEGGRRVLFEGAQGRCWTSIMARSRSSPAATAPASACRAGRACRPNGSIG